MAGSAGPRKATLLPYRIPGYGGPAQSCRPGQGLDCRWGWIAFMHMLGAVDGSLPSPGLIFLICIMEQLITEVTWALPGFGGQHCVGNVS